MVNLFFAWWIDQFNEINSGRNMKPFFRLTQRINESIEHGLIKAVPLIGTFCMQKMLKTPAKLTADDVTKAVNQTENLLSERCHVINDDVKSKLMGDLNVEIQISQAKRTSSVNVVSSKVKSSNVKAWSSDIILCVYQQFLASFKVDKK